jgi:hypothetical protein
MPCAFLFALTDWVKPLRRRGVRDTSFVTAVYPPPPRGQTRHAEGSMKKIMGAEKLMKIAGKNI